MNAETSNARGEWVLERLRGVLEHGKMGGKCLIAPDLVTDAIAALSAQQSPAEAQPVDGLRMVKLSDAWDYAHGALSWNELDARAIRCPAEAQPVAWLVRWQHGRKRLGITIADSVAAENYYHWRNGGENNQPVELLPLYTEPQSAPVGDDRWKALIGQWQRRVGAAGYGGVEDALDAAVAAKSAPVGVERIAAEIRASLGHGATVATRRRWAIELEALAQQPAAVGENRRLANALQSLLRYVERCREAGVLVCDDIGPEEFARYELEQALSLPPEQPAAVDEAMVERAWVAFCENNGSSRQGIRAALTAALAAQPGGSDNDRQA